MPTKTEIWGVLLTDVVDSTALVERLGPVEAARLWAAHDTIARGLLPEHRGREIDKTDGFLLLFGSASDAVRYAAAYHAAIGRLDPPLTARAGIHVGEVVLRATPAAEVALGAKPLEVDGPAKPLAARVMSVAPGGRTLLTAAAREALDPALGARASSQGHWQLKGVTRPVELFEVDGADAPPPADAAKAWRVVRRNEVWLPVREVPHALPAERDLFVGRDDDLKRLASLLDTSRLVSVLGIGGTGKTRLVTRFAWTWLGDFPGGAWFCDLSEARSAEGIVAAVARALDVPLSRQDPVVQLGDAIAARGPCLIVLDNFEQVARYAPETLGTWLDRAAEARFVVTTREVLGLPGEAALALAPLGGDESVELFVTRSRQAKPDFALAEGERAVVADLVRLLDGLPLAIELAAARVRLMPPKALLQRMGERFRLLASSGGRHSRQATLRAALDWSWDLLAPDEQAALAQLSVFEGGFTLEWAEQVLALDAMWPMDAVQALVDKSLVRRVGPERFDLLVSVQAYADERLVAAGGVDEAHRRHARALATLGSPEALDALSSPSAAARYAQLAEERDNLLAACRRATALGEWEAAAATLLAALGAVQISAPTTMVVGLASDLAARPDLPGEHRGSVLRTLSLALRGDGQPARARDVAIEALPYARDQRWLEAALLTQAASAASDLGDYPAAVAWLEQALAIHLPTAKRHLRAQALDALAGIRQHQAGYQQAEAATLAEQALGLYRACGSRRGEAGTHVLLANLLRTRGNLADAKAHLDAAAAAARELGDARTLSYCLGNLAYLENAQGQHEAAMLRAEQTLTLARIAGNRTMETFVVGLIGMIHHEQGRLIAAVEALSASVALARAMGFHTRLREFLGKLGAALAESGRRHEAEAAWAESEAMLLAHDEPDELGILYADRATVLARLGERTAAEESLELARRCAERCWATPESELGVAMEKARVAIAANV